MGKSGAVLGGRGLHLLRVAGIPIRVEASWLLVFVLVLWSISAGYLPARFPDLTVGQYWLAGLVATLLFFGSLLVHELAHSLVAMREGIEIREITLFLFGGVSGMTREPTRPGVELRIAVVGPLASFALAAGFGGLAFTLGPTLPPLVGVVLEYLAWINAALGVFNLIPGFPLDGGRVLRAIVWWKTGSLRRATRMASNIGQGFAITLMGLGAIEVFAGALVGGLWLIFIGMFLRGLAAAGYEELVLRMAIENVDVQDVMVREPLCVSPEISLRELVDRHFLRDDVRSYPVKEGGKVVGVVSLADLADVPRDRFDPMRVADVMAPMGESLRIDPEASLAQALQQMAREGEGRLLVMRDEKLLGLLTRGGVQRMLEIKRVLEEPSLEPSGRETRGDAHEI